MTQSENSKENPKSSQPVTGTMLPDSVSNSGRTSPSTPSGGRNDATGSNSVQGTMVAPPIGSSGSATPFATLAPAQRSVTKTMGVDTAAGRSIAQVLGTVSNQRKETMQTNIPRSNTQPPRRHRAVGKSTWNLRIHKKLVAGQISGIANQVGPDDAQAGGLMSAFLQGASSPEYEIKGALGEGSMGVVYRATQTSLNRPLAIKTLKADIQDPIHHQEMFVSEAVVTANLVHPNIVPIHDLGHTEDGKLFYSMKQVNGTSWDKLIDQKTQEENLEILMKVCDAVAYAHSRGVINRDLKPENVVVGDFGEVIVLDWGLSVTTERFEKRNSVLIEYQGGVGTPVYMAPELASENVDEVCPQSDIYLLGGILFEILEGFQPHYLKWIQQIADPDQKFAAVCQAIVNNDIEPDVRNTGELMLIARKAMATDPRDRYPSVEQFQEAIREYRITGRAEELLEVAKDRKNDDYDEFQQSVALFSDALVRWPANQRAIKGDLTAREAFARLALKKGDYDLGLEVVSGRRELVLANLAAKLRKARRFRTIVKSTWFLLFAASVAALIGLQFLYGSVNEAKNAKAEAEKQKQIALDDAEKAAKEAEQTTRDAEQKVVDANKKAEEVQEQARKATALANKDADDARMRADDAKKDLKDAQNALTDAQNALKDAQKSTITAQELADKAKVDSENARKQAEEAAMKAAAANAALKASRNEALKAELSRHESSVNAAMDLEEYGQVVERGMKAVNELEAKLNPELDEALRKLFESRIAVIREKIGIAKGKQNLQVNTERPTLSSTVSEDGTVLALLLNTSPKRTVEIWSTELRKKLHTVDVSRNGGATVTLSPTGSVLVVSGTNGAWVEAWTKTAAGYESLELPFRPSSPISFCRFAHGDRHLFAFEKNSLSTVHILDVQTPKLLTKLDLYPRLNSDIEPQTVEVSNDGSYIIMLPQKHDPRCRAFYVVWNGEVPQISVVDREAPALEVQGESGQSIRKVKLSPDGRYLLTAIEARDGSVSMTVLPKLKDTNSKLFPFEAITPDRSFFHCTRRDLPVEIAISQDGSRIAAANAMTRSNIQMWDVVDYQVANCSTRGLRDSKDGKLLSGMANRIRTMSFRTALEVVCVPEASNLICFWNLQEYDEYISLLKQIQTLFSELTTTIPASAALQSDAIRSNRRRIAELASQQDYIPAVLQSDETSKQLTETNQPYELRQTSDDSLRRVFSADFSEDGSRIVIGASDLAAHVYKSDTGTKSLSMSGRGDWLLGLNDRNYFVEGHNSEVKTIRFLPPDGDLLLTAENLGVISVWDAKADEDGIGQERSRLIPQYATSDFVISEDGAWVLAGGAAVNPDKNAAGPETLLHQALLWSVKDIRQSIAPREVRTFSGQHRGAEITAVAISPDSTQVLTCGRRGRIVLWNLNDSSVISTVDGTHDGDAVSGAAFIDPAHFVTTGFDGSILLWSIEQNQLRSSKIHRGSFILRMERSPDRKFIAFHDITFANADDPSARSQLSIRILDVSRAVEGTVPTPTTIHPFSFTREESRRVSRSGCTWFPDSSKLLLTIDGNLLIFTTDDWKRESAFKLDDGQKSEDPGLARYYQDRLPSRAAVSPKDPHIATLSGRQAHLWNLTDGKHLAEFRTHHSQRLTSSFSSDRKFVLTASETLRVFDAEETSPTRGRTMFRMDLSHNHNHPLTGAHFSPAPGDYRFLSFDDSGEVRLWSWAPSGGPPKQPTIVLPAKVESLPDWATDEGIRKPSTSASWSQDASRIVACRRGKLECWNVVENKLTPLAIDPPKTVSLDGTGTDQTEVDWLFNDATFSRTNHIVSAGGLARVNGVVLPGACVWRIETDGTTSLVAALIDQENRHQVSTRNEAPGGITSLWQFESRLITGGSEGNIIKWSLPNVETEKNGIASWLIDVKVPNDPSVPEARRIAGHGARITSLKAAPLQPTLQPGVKPVPARIVSSDDAGRVIVWPGSNLE